MEKASSTSTPWKPISGSLTLEDPKVAAACSGLSEAIPDVGGQGPLVHLQSFLWERGGKAYVWGKERKWAFKENKALC